LKEEIEFETEEKTRDPSQLTQNARPAGKKDLRRKKTGDERIGDSIGRPSRRFPEKRASGWRRLISGVLEKKYYFQDKAPST